MEEGFFEKVYDLVRLVPYGRITTYGAIARCLGTARSARMVGWALNQCHSQKLYVPAHRVVNRKGLLTGKHFFDGPDMMQQLLENEGIIIQNDMVAEFDKHFWDPSLELR